MKSEMKWNSKHLFELATTEINAMWRSYYRRYKKGVLRNFANFTEKYLC